MPGPVFIRGESVDLHVVDEEDLPFLQTLVNDPDVWRGLQRSAPVTEKEERIFYEEHLQAEDQEHLLVCANGEPVGIVGLNSIDPVWGVAELGYFIDPAARRQGYGTAGVELLVEYAFGQRRIEKLLAYVLVSNQGSRGVLENNGFEAEGRLRNYAFVDGDRIDVLVYGLLAEEAGLTA